MENFHFSHYFQTFLKKSLCNGLNIESRLPIDVFIYQFKEKTTSGPKCLKAITIIIIIIIIIIEREIYIYLFIYLFIYTKCKKI